MNVQTLKQTSAILTLSVPTLSDPTSVAVFLDIRVMVETAQVNEINLLPLFLMAVLNASRFQFIVVLILQPSFLAVLHLVVQWQVARNKTDFLFVSVRLVTKVTDTNVQVGLLYTKSKLSTLLPFWGSGTGRGRG